MHVDDELRAVDAIGKAGEILDHCRGGKLPARLRSLKDKRIQVRARGVNRGGQARATAADDDHFLHEQT